jgi:transcriptional regulator with XRE-family HTH domain
MKYSTQELAEILKVSDRTVRRYLSTYISFDNNRFEVSEKMLEILKNEYLGQDADNQKEEEFDVIEGFTNEEYQEFQKRLIEYPMLQKDLEYHRESSRSHQRQMEIILRNMEQRNFIEAKDKKLE